MTKGKRVQIYIPADLTDKWDALPRYERSGEVSAALRAWWTDRADLIKDYVRASERLQAEQKINEQLRKQVSALAEENQEMKDFMSQ